MPATRYFKKSSYRRVLPVGLNLLRSTKNQFACCNSTRMGKRSILTYGFSKKSILKSWSLLVFPE
ncbi:hypothetical protein GBA52_026529 [Prunus armeniaca]|nr:hypothetical protein GBA52_026529 [Prunus armeniaca]